VTRRRHIDDADAEELLVGALRLLDLDTSEEAVEQYGERWQRAVRVVGRALEAAADGAVEAHEDRRADEREYLRGAL
jgi:hypothetical protein